MPLTTVIFAVIACALVCVAGALVLRKRRLRAQAKDMGDLPRFLYLAGHSPDDADAQSPRRSIAGPRDQGWTAARRVAGNGSTSSVSDVGWAAAADETVQLLPGRLEPASGGAAQEIRFIRKPGVSRFTFGRSRGPAFQHVQLRAPSASRMHAYMEFEDGRWSVGGLSRTNEVVVNGAPLTAGASHRLADGDRIELGEAAFVFRQPGLLSEAPDDVA